MPSCYSPLLSSLSFSLAVIDEPGPDCHGLYLFSSFMPDMAACHAELVSSICYILFSGFYAFAHLSLLPDMPLHLLSTCQISSMFQDSGNLINLWGAFLASIVRGKGFLFCFFLVPFTCFCLSLPH